MQALLTWIATAAAGAVGAVLLFRLLNGLDPLTGDDPRVIAAISANPTFTITFIPKSYGVYEIADRSSGLKAHIDLPRGETLAGPLQLGRCGAESGLTLPDWLPRFPHAKAWACITAMTNEGSRQHASFTTNLQTLEEVFAFYQEALESLPAATAGHTISRAPLWSAVQFRHDMDSGRRIAIRYFYDTLDRRYEPIVTLAFDDER